MKILQQLKQNILNDYCSFKMILYKRNKGVLYFIFDIFFNLFLIILKDIYELYDQNYDLIQIFIIISTNKKQMKLHYSTEGAANNRFRKIKAVANALGVKVE